MPCGDRSGQGEPRVSIRLPIAHERGGGRYKLQFTVGEETYQKVRRAQDLLRHTMRSGDPAEVFDRALTLLLADLERTKFAATPRPRASSTAGKRSRHVPADVRRAVWARDGGRCRFEGPAERRGDVRSMNAITRPSTFCATLLLDRRIRHRPQSVATFANAPHVHAVCAPKVDQPSGLNRNNFPAPTAWAALEIH
jgi:hypothetical protein